MGTEITRAPCSFLPFYMASDLATIEIVFHSDTDDVYSVRIQQPLLCHQLIEMLLEAETRTHPRWPITGEGKGSRSPPSHACLSCDHDRHTRAETAHTHTTHTRPHPTPEGGVCVCVLFHLS